MIAESFERIHRSNLVGMGILPLQFSQGDSIESLGLSGCEVFSVEGIADGVASGFAAGRELAVRALRHDGSSVKFNAIARIDTPQEIHYYRHGGILQFVMRQLLGDEKEASAPRPPPAARPLRDGDSDPGVVEEASIESFPASDVPSYMGKR